MFHRNKLYNNNNHPTDAKHLYVGFFFVRVLFLAVDLFKTCTSQIWFPVGTRYTLYNMEDSAAIPDEKR